MMTERGRGTGVIVAFTVLLLPATAFANAGTVLMWATMVHLVLGNAVLGAIEGFLIATWFKLPKWRSIGVLVVANYASAGLGSVILKRSVSASSDLTLYDVKHWFVGALCVAFLVTLLVEFPFFWWVLRSRKSSFVSAMTVTPLVHLCSYGLLVGWYWEASNTSLISDWELVAPDELRFPDTCTLFYLSVEGDQLWRMDWGKHEVKKVALDRDVSAPSRNDRLFARSNESGLWDLWLRGDYGHGRGGAAKVVPLLEGVGSRAPVDAPITRGVTNQVEGTAFSVGEVPSIAAGSSRSYYVGYWAGEGLRAYVDGEKEWDFGVELPYLAWPVRNATQIDGDLVVFQLGEDQICVLQPEKRQVALLARGKGPIVVGQSED